MLVQAGMAAKMNFTDKDVIDFLVNVEWVFHHAMHIRKSTPPCWGTFGTTFNNNLTLGGPTPIGARKANLSPQAYAYMEEVALNEQARPLPGSGCSDHS